MLTNSLAYATLPTADIDAARRFWVDTLGFTVRETGPDGSLILEAGDGSCICLYPSTFAGTNQATACAFQVADVVAEVGDLKRKGVTFEEYDMPGLKTE